MSQTYRNLVFTNHALERKNQRYISPDKIYDVINYPNKTYQEGSDTKKYIKKISGRNYHVIAKYLGNENKYLVISAWVRGEDDQAPLIIRLVWFLITLPFKLLWSILKLIFKR